MTRRQTVSLLGGELLVTKKGVYTFVHFYKHPETSTEVVFVGMNHMADLGYFQRVHKILSSCDLVLFENIFDEEEMAQEEKAALQKRVRDGNPRDIFIDAMQLYFLESESAIGLPREGQFFGSDYEQSHWFSGDAVPSATDPEQTKEGYEKIQRLSENLSLERREEIVDFVKCSLEKMKAGLFTSADFAESFVFFYSDPVIVSMFLETFARERDFHCFETFDRLVEERNPRKIGIKFGAGHIAFQRELLERRGYCRTKTLRLRNILLT